MTNPLLSALAQARLREAPMFVRWCELNGVTACPATPASVALFVVDCASLGISRLWPAVQDISRMHTALGLADPTLGGPAASAISAISGLTPPRSWPDRFKQRFAALPYDVQLHLASHETQRERALRHAQNEAAATLRKLAAFQAGTKDDRIDEDETAPKASA